MGAAAARRLAIPRRGPRPGPRLYRHDRALGKALSDGPSPDGPHGRTLSAPCDKVIRFRLNKPFPLLPEALAEPYCAIMPERLAKTDAFEQIKEAVGSGPFKYVASERIP